MIAWKCLVKDNVVSKVMPRNLAEFFFCFFYAFLSMDDDNPRRVN